MSLKDTLEELCTTHHLVFILAINDEGMVMADAGDVPADGFAPYAPMAIETARRMALNGELDEPVCSALILQGGRMLIMYQSEIANRVVYLALVCRKVPAGLKKLLDNIASEVGKALGIHPS